MTASTAKICSVQRSAGSIVDHPSVKIGRVRKKVRPKGLTF